MHLRSCYVFFLLALVACQAAPPKPEILGKKSISEETSNIDQDLKPEDHSVDKDRTKKSAKFCVEIDSNQKVPCEEDQPQSLFQMVQPVSLAELSVVPQSTHVIRPHVPSPPPQTIHFIQPETPAPPPSTIRFIQQEAPALPAQTIRLIQPEVMPSQTFHMVKPETPTPPPQTIHVIQSNRPEPTPTPPPTPRPESIKVLQPALPQQTQIVLPAAQPVPAAHTTNIVLPAPQPQLAPQPPNIVLPPPQPMHQPASLQPLNVFVPQLQAAPAQQTPIVNILPVPTSDSYNQRLTVQPQPEFQRPTVPHPTYPQETVPTKVMKPALKPKPEIASLIEEKDAIENPSCQEILPTSLLIIKEPRPLQWTTTCNQPHHLVTGCDCPQSFLYKSKGSLPTGPSSARHHKIHEHHVTVYPGVSSMSAVPAMPALSAMPAVPAMPALSAMPALAAMPALPVMPALPAMPYMTKTPCSFLSENPSPIVFTPETVRPESRYGDTIISVQAGENPRPAYSSEYFHSYDSRPHNPSMVTVNTYPSLRGPIYRQAQSTGMQQHTLLANEKQNNLAVPEVINFSKGLNNQRGKLNPSWGLKEMDRKISQK